MLIIRPTHEQDLAPLGELLDGIFRRPRGASDQSMLSDFPLVFAPSNWRNCRVVVENGRLVGHAALWRRELVIDEERLSVGILAAVATHPDYRQRGYAAQAVRSLQAQMHDEGYDLGLLWTAVPDFYHKLGWQAAERRGTIIVLQPERLVAAPASQHEIARFDPVRHADAVYALHDRERIRFLRSPEESQTLLALPKIEAWIATRAGELVAYLVHGAGCNKRGLIEYGGDLSGITDLATHVALQQQPPGSELLLLAYHTRPDLIEWAQRLGLPLRPLDSSKGFGYEMIYPVRRERYSLETLDKLFAWGLEHA